MNVRLRVTSPGSPPYTFEHAGPLVHIGRDPACELSFPYSDVVSGHHAILELGEHGLFLADTNSSNGTFLGDSEERLRRVSLSPGSRFRLGATGPEVVVTSFDVAPPAPPARPEPPIVLEPDRPAPRPKPKPLSLDEAPQVVVKQGASTGALLGIGAGVLVGVAAIVFFAWPKSKSSTPGSQAEVAERKDKEKPPDPIKIDNDKPKEKEPIKIVEPKKKEPDKVDPLGDSKPVGVFQVAKDGPPTLLIQRRRDPEPWARLRDGDRVDSDYHLVSLPGYRSRIVTESGIRMVLWGNVPQFSLQPPVLDSAVVLQAPSKEFDLDFTLERGRVHLTKTKEGDRRVRVRFLGEMWDITLSSPTTEVVVELWGFDPPPGTPGVNGTVFVAGLFTKGSGSVKIGGREQRFTEPAQLFWSNQGKANLTLAPQGPLPWWTDQLDPKTNREVGLAMLALGDLHDALTKNNDLVDTVLTQVKESSDPGLRTLGVSFLAAMDGLPHLLILLENQHGEVRGEVSSALRRWIARGPDQRGELLRALQSRGGYSKEKAEIILRLLQGYTPQEAAKPDVFGMLIGYLNHDNLAVRELAGQNLATLAPAVAKEVAYDPAGNAAARQKAIDAWKQKTGGRLPPGK